MRRKSQLKLKSKSKFNFQKKLIKMLSSEKL